MVLPRGNRPRGQSEGSARSAGGGPKGDRLRGPGAGYRFAGAGSAGPGEGGVAPAVRQPKLASYRFATAQ